MDLLDKVPMRGESADAMDVTRSVERRRPATLARQDHYFVFLALVSIGAALLLLFFFCPRFVLWRGLWVRAAWGFSEVRRAVNTFQQIDDPFARIPDPLHRVITWRLLFPLVWHYLALPRWSFLLMPYLGSLFTLGLTAHVVFQRTANRWWAFLSAVLIGACPWFLVSTGWLAYFDSWVMGGLLLLAFGNSRIVLAIVCLLTPWIDERFLLAAPLCFVLRAVDVGPGGRRQARDWLLDGTVVLVTSLTYPLLRAILAAQYGVGSDEIGAYTDKYLTWTHVISVSPIRYIAGVWMGLRIGWFFVAILFWQLWTSHRRWLGSGLAVIFVGTTAVGLVIAEDIGRNVCLVVPLAIAGVVGLARRRPGVLRIGLPTIVTANLLLPMAHVMTTEVLPVYYLYAETNRWSHPPVAVDPNNHTQQGIQFFSQGDLDMAMSSFGDALTLDAGFGPAYVARAMVRVKLGDLEGAAEDLGQAVRLRPQDPDVYYVRAMMRRQRREVAGAVSDLRAALQFAPEGWPPRQEAEDMLRELTAQPATERVKQ